MSKMNRRVNLSMRPQSGFTLVELMVAMVLSLLLMAAVSQVYLLNKRSFVAQAQSSLVQESGNFALEYLGRDLRMAGLLGCSSRRPGNQALPVRSYLNDNDYPYDVLGHAVFGYEAQGTGTGATYNISATNPAPGGSWSPALPAATNSLAGKVIPGTDVVVMSGTEGSDIPLVSPFTSGAQIFVDDTSPFAVGDVLLVTDCQQAELFQATNVVAASGNIVGSQSGAFTPGNASPIAEQGPVGPFTEGSRISLLRSYAYYVGRGANGTPTLFRAQLNSGTMQDQELVSNVESMQIVYGIDNDEDYVVDSYVTADAVPNWQQVRALRLSLLVRSPQPFLDSDDTASYVLAGTTVNPVDDRRQRRVFTSTIALRNRLL